MAKAWFSESSHLSRGIFFLCVLYVVCAAPLLFFTFVVPKIPHIYNNQDILPYILIGFSVVSFALIVVVSAYHLSTLIRRRKRKGDIAPQPAA